MFVAVIRSTDAPIDIIGPFDSVDAANAAIDASGAITTPGVWAIDIVLASAIADAVRDALTPA
jgi:hypothetical protein